jgi:hypothetical protein
MDLELARERGLLPLLPAGTEPAIAEDDDGD